MDAVETAEVQSPRAFRDWVWGLWECQHGQVEKAVAPPRVPVGPVALLSVWERSC